MSGVRASQIEWRPVWEVAHAAHLARLHTALVGVRGSPLIRALVDEIRTLRRWRGYAQAEREGFLLALARRDTTIHRLRTESRRRSTSVARDEAARDRGHGGSGRVPAGGPSETGRRAPDAKPHCETAYRRQSPRLLSTYIRTWGSLDRRLRGRGSRRGWRGKGGGVSTQVRDMVHEPTDKAA